MNEHLKKLLEQRAEKHEAMQKLLASAKEEGRGLTKEEGEKYDALEREFDNLTADIKRTEKQIEREKDMNAPANKPIFSQYGDDSQREDEAKSQIETYTRAFWKAQKGEVLTPEESRSLNTGTAEKGGYLVPESFAETIIMKCEEKSYIRDLATTSKSTSIENLPVEGDDGENAWIDEEGTYPESDPTISQVQLAAWKTGRIIKVSEEAMQDTVPAIEGYVATKFSKSTTKAEESAFVSGDGVKKPTGFLETAEVGKTAASTTAFTADEIIDIEYSLDEDYAQNAYWMMNRNTLSMVRKLKDADGNYIWSKGLAGEPDTLDGYPIRVNKHMPDVATGTKPIAFGDFSYYHIKDRLVMDLKRLDEKYSDTGHIGFRITKRVDGKLVLPEAVKTLQMA